MNKPLPSWSLHSIERIHKNEYRNIQGRGERKFKNPICQVAMSTKGKITQKAVLKNGQGKSHAEREHLERIPETK